MTFRCLSAAAAMLWLTSCAGNRVIRDYEYQKSVEAFQNLDFENAREQFPSRERGGFITSLETGWLSFWSGKSDPTPLLKQVETFDQRRYVSISREAGYFLFQESEEGYVPGEHEIIILHLIAAQHFLATTKTEDARVELRRAGYILDRYWDDASLRLWLGALWHSAGDWEEAKVDFRRAGELNGDQELRKLGEQKRPPANLNLHFFGVGPHLEWQDGDFQPRFASESRKTDYADFSAATLPWYQRHEKRNTALRDILVKSNFMAQYLGGKTMTYAATGLSKAAAWTVRILGATLGVAIVGGAIALAAQSESADSMKIVEPIMIAGVGLGTGIWAAGRDFDKAAMREIYRGDKRKQEDLRIYRVVRFMPNWIGVSLKPWAERPNTIERLLPNGTGLINHF